MLTQLAFDLGDSLILQRRSGIGTVTVGDTYNSFSSFINLLVPVVFIISGVILFFLLIGGGFSIIASGGNAKNVEGGKNQITTAIIGFVVIFCAYWIVKIVEILTGVPIFNSTL